MTVPPRPLREITPEQRQRTLRTFLWILVGFAAGIGIMVAILSAGGRAVRDHGQAVLRSIENRPAGTGVRSGQPCETVLPRALPPGALSCQIELVGTDRHPEVVIRIEGDRLYRVKP
ncbi:hypothetical protein [Deinococcus navajonensis]|uniref:DUF4333 domain-containing protein n=1 Tax=Deinococcus navajonensis TaxID=309884 RepID=A0ABV8XS66_9DEIO